MKQTILFIFICLFTTVALLTACRKDATIDKELYLRGRLFVTDSFVLNQVGVPLPKKRVMLVDGSQADTLNYIYSDSTDKDGYFLFKLLNPGNYKVRFSDSIGSYRYYGESPAASGANDIVLTAYLDSADFSGVKIRCRDRQGGGVPGATVSFYLSQGQALSQDLSAVSLTVTADAYGNATTYQLKPGVYYVNGSKTVNGTVLKQLAKSITVQKGRRTDSTLVLPPFPDTASLAGLKVISMDSLGGYMKDASVTVYRSKLQADLGDVSSAVFSKTSDGNGEVTTYALDPGIYYINSKKAIDTKEYSVSSTQVTLTKGQLAPVTLILLRTK